MSHPLVDAPTLARELEGPAPPVPLDVRWTLADGAGRGRYLAGHLPGARFVDLDTDLAGPPGTGGRHPLPAPDQFVAAMRRLGVGNASPVVVYDDGPGLAAARAWWLLRWAGHEQVRVLDGGWAGWSAGGHPAEEGAVEAAGGDFALRASLAPVLEADAIPAFVAEGHLLLDARDRPRFLGEVEPVDPVAGHIPGATSAPTGENVGPDGTLLRAGQLRAHFERLGLGPDTGVAVYCGSGVTAAHEILALEVAGWRAALYAGSWSHWVTDPGRPVATGP